MGGVAEKFQPGAGASALPAIRSRWASPTGFLSTLGGAPVCVLAFLLKPDFPDRDGAMQSRVRRH